MSVHIRTSVIRVDPHAHQGIAAWGPNATKATVLTLSTVFFDIELDE